MFLWIVVTLTSCARSFPTDVHGWLGKFRIPDLTENLFDDFVQQHPKALIDFVRTEEKQKEALFKVARALRRQNSSVALAQVNVDDHPNIAKRFFKGCDEEKQVCEDSFPRLLWFRDGQVTKYHMIQHDVIDIFGFAMAMDRKYISPVANENELSDAFNRHLLFRGERTSPMYATLERIAAQRMDSLAVSHIEEPNTTNVTLIFDDHENRYETFPAGFTGGEDEDAVQAFIRRHLVFGENEPEDPALDADGSTVVVAASFERQVLRNDTDVFLLVYAPWCGYSRRTLPEWSRFVTNLHAAGLPQVVAAKMNGALNVIDTPEYRWSKFPTIAYFSAGDKVPTLYEGQRTADAFLNFVLRHGHHNINESVAFYQPQVRSGSTLSAYLTDGDFDDEMDL